MTPISFIWCCLRCRSFRTPALAQASGGRVDRVADGIAGHKKFNSPVLLTARGAIVGRYRQTVAETSGRDRTRRYSLLHQVVAHRSGTILRQGLIHGVAA